MAMEVKLAMVLAFEAHTLDLSLCFVEHINIAYISHARTTTLNLNGMHSIR